MIISDEQALLAARYLTTSCPPNDCASLPAVSDDVLAAAHAVVEQTPETRIDRVREARVYLSSGEMNAQDVASKMISRIICDSIR